MSDITRSIKCLLYKITEENLYLTPFDTTYISKAKCLWIWNVQPHYWYFKLETFYFFSCRKYHELHLKVNKRKQKQKKRLGKADEKANSTLAYMSPGGEGIKLVGDSPLSFSYSPLPGGPPW